MKLKLLSSLNHFTVPVAMSHACQPMYASRNVREAEVIALIPVARHSRTPTP